MRKLENDEEGMSSCRAFQHLHTYPGRTLIFYQIRNFKFWIEALST